MTSVAPPLREPIEVHPADPGIDLKALDSTRQGFDALGIGLGLLFLSTGLLGIEGSPIAMHLARILRAFGLFWMLVGLGVFAPTPNGPLPQWARYGFLGLVGSALLGVLLIPLGWFSGSMQLFTGLERAAEVSSLVFLWILWRYCQDRGLTGRALVWLWLAMMGTLMAAIVVFSDADWLARFFPGLGALCVFAARSTAREIWLDAVNRTSKSIYAPKEEPEPLEG